MTPYSLFLNWPSSEIREKVFFMRQIAVRKKGIDFFVIIVMIKNLCGDSHHEYNDLERMKLW